MDYIHCNSCKHVPSNLSPARKYFMTSCGHIFCEGCARRIQQSCLCCPIKPRLVEINSESGTEIKNYFLDPMNLIKDGFKAIFTNLQFQRSQASRFANSYRHLYDSCVKMENENETLRVENQKLKSKLEELELKQIELANKEAEVERSVRSVPSSSIFGSVKNVSKNGHSLPTRSNESFLGSHNTMSPSTLRAQVNPQPTTASNHIQLNQSISSNLTHLACSENNQRNSRNDLHYGSGRLTQQRNANYTTQSSLLDIFNARHNNGAASSASTITSSPVPSVRTIYNNNNGSTLGIGRSAASTSSTFLGPQTPLATRLQNLKW